MIDEIRVFLGVNLDLRTTRRVADLQKRLHDGMAERARALRWVPPTNLHVTLKFLGAIDAPLVNAIRDALRPVLGTRRPFRVRARGLGAFPDTTAPQVVWAGVDDETGALGVLSATVDEQLLGVGFSREKRKFHPHVTLARVKSHEGLGLAEAFAAVGPVDCGESPISEVVVYRSDSVRSGVEYQALERLPLAAKP
jgi:RNA 2',3'-cyclic 3'-phosphodiesterase